MLQKERVIYRKTTNLKNSLNKKSPVGLCLYAKLMIVRVVVIMFMGMEFFVVTEA